MSRLNPETWAAGVASIVREFVERRLGDVLPKVAALDGRTAELDGRLQALDTRLSAVPVDVLTGEVRALDARVAALPLAPTAADLRAAVEAGLQAPLERLAELEGRPVADPGALAAVSEGVRQLEDRVAGLPTPPTAEAIRAAVDAGVAGYADRLSAVEARPAGDPDGVAALAGQMVGLSARLASLPERYLTEADVVQTITVHVDPQAALSALSDLQVRTAALEARPLPPPPPDITGLGTALKLAMTEELDARMAALPPPEPGLPGPAPTAEQVRAAVDGYLGTWAADFERHAAEVLERAAARIPKPEDGKDGLGFDDLDILFDGERTTTFRLARGDQVKEWKFRDARMLERGVYIKGRAYEAGDGVTWGGHFWVAQRDTDEPPVEAGDAWRLVVRRGRDGKGLKGEPGGKGEPGKDGQVRWMRT